MKRKTMIIILGVMLFFLVGCAMLQLGKPHYKTFELTISGQKIVVNLPKELPSMDKAESAGEACFNAKVCRQRFCVTEDLGHDHVDFVYMELDVIALVWIKAQETEFDKRFVAWVYIKGEPVAAPITRIQEMIRERESKKDDSV